MRKRKPHDVKPETPEGSDTPPAGTSRRDFLTSGAVGLAVVAAGAGSSAATTLSAGVSGSKLAKSLEPKRKLLKGGIVLTLEQRDHEGTGDFEKADVLINGKKIEAIGPNLGNGQGAQVIDCSGTIVMPGFITTHHHQYETPARSVIPDGLLQGGWPQESYGSVVQNIWTAGRIPGVWDINRPPMEPEDVYLAELVASLSQLTEGITCGVDTSQSSHTAEHTDAMIQGLMDSGARAVYDYSGGTNRGGSFEYPGAIGNTTSGLGRIATRYFSSKDQLVTLAFAGGPGNAFTGAPYTGWQMARHFGASINNHNVGSPQTVINAAADPRNNERDWSDVTLVHCVRWNDAPLAQHSYRPHGYPNPSTSTAWQIFADKGGHASIANIIEMQMRHGMPPFQMALNYGILPSLSPDVDTNMTTDPFSLMRGAFCLQRALANDLAFASSNPGALPIPQLITARQCIEMATIAGAASAQLLDKVGTLKVGKEADIVVLDARNINVTPMNNVPGTIVTMMNARHVRDVFVAGEARYTKGKLVGWDMNKLMRDLEQSHERILSRIRGPSILGPLPPGNNSTGGSNYRPNFLGSCCYDGQNATAPHYTLRP
jgi:5-methylthioadenosine/S-adenosylhomocysteine deaminase